MSQNQGLLWLSGLFGLGLLAAASSPRGRRTVEDAVEKVEETVAEVVEEGVDWIKRIVDRTSKHEGTYDSLNLNTDKAGLSFGRIQWSQRTGALGKLLSELYLTDPPRFESTFGSSWQKLLDVTRVGSLEPLNGAVLWAEPWVARFKAAGRDPVFQKVQDRLAMHGEYIAAAIVTAKILGVSTERAISIAYDTSVQQGSETAKIIARKVQTQLQGQTLPAKHVLERYVETAAAPFRTVQQPGRHSRSPDLEWRAVGSEWHVFAGKVDLFTNILSRRMRLLNDRTLSDTTITV